MDMLLNKMHKANNLQVAFPKPDLSHIFLIRKYDDKRRCLCKSYKNTASKISYGNIPIGFAVQRLIGYYVEF